MSPSATEVSRLSVYRRRPRIICSAPHGGFLASHRASAGQLSAEQGVANFQLRDLDPFVRADDAVTNLVAGAPWSFDLERHLVWCGGCGEILPACLMSPVSGAKAQPGIESARRNIRCG